MRLEVPDVPRDRIDAEHVKTEVERALRTAVVVHIRGLEKLADPLRFLGRLAGETGDVVTTNEDPTTGLRATSSFWEDVRFDPRYSTTFRHHNSGQPLHTDGAYYADAPNTVMFYCERQAIAGGATLFLDVVDFERALKADRPQLYERLTTVTVKFFKMGQLGRDARILDYDVNGTSMNWNYYRVSPEQSADVLETCEELHAYLQERFVDSPVALQLRLAPGDVVIFRDERVLHGRQAFAAEKAGDRLIWKCSFNLNDCPWD
jgi:alpha-ketoglutarate-dependent taurine dioxygenase